MITYPLRLCWIVSLFLFSTNFRSIAAQSACTHFFGGFISQPQTIMRGISLAATPEGDGIYMAGLKQDSVLLIKRDLSGYIIWAKTFDVIPGKIDHLSTILVDAEGMIACAGTTGNNFSIDGGTVFVFRYNPYTDKVLWVKEFLPTVTRNFCLTMIQKSGSGNYLISNLPESVSQSNSYAELFELDRFTGNVAPGIYKTYDLGGADDLFSIAEYDGYIYGTGRFTDGGTTADMRHALIKIDATNGKAIWTKLGHRPAHTTARLYGVDLVIDNDMIYSGIVGDENGTSITATNIFIQKTNLDGAAQWVKKYDFPGSNDYFCEMIKSENGIVVLATQKEAPYQYVLFKINADGQVIWATSFLFNEPLNTASPLIGDAQMIEVGGFIYFTGYTTQSAIESKMFLYTVNAENGQQDMPGFHPDCSDYVLIDINVEDVVNPVFYSVQPTEGQPDFMIEDRSTVSHNSPLFFDPNCVLTDTLFQTVEASICEGESYEGYAQSGTYEDYFTSHQGCDSLRKLTLSVIACDSANCKTITGAVYGTADGDEFGYSLAVTPAKDGFYVSGHRGDSALIVKMNLFGEIIWSRTMDIIPGVVDHVGTIFVDDEGNLAMAGTAGDPDAGGSIFACRYNPNLNQVLWAKEYITNLTRERCFSLIQKDQGGNYILSSNPDDVMESNDDAALLEIDKNTGNILPAFSKQYNVGGSETINKIVMYDNAIYGAGRYTDGSLPAQMRNTLVKIDPISGHHVWAKLGHVARNATARLYGFDLIIKDDNIYSGYHGDASGISTSNTKLYVQKTSLDGTLIWLKQYDLPGNTDFGFELIESGDGIVILAENRSTPRQLFMFKIDLSGEMIWAKEYHFPVVMNSDAYYYGRNQLVEIGNQLIFTGYGTSSEYGNEMLVVRTDLTGEVLSPCVASENIEIKITDITNPVFYPVDVEETNAQHEERSFQPILFESPVHPEEQCILVDTVFAYLETTICEGQQFEGYTDSGIYEDYFTSSNGCDSLRTLSLHVVACPSLVYYSLNACSSFTSNGSNMDYSEFEPEYSSENICAQLSASTLFRFPPQENKHSCTPGVNSSIGMCITALPTCTYLPGDPSSLITEIHINPEVDSILKLTKLEFYERSPATYTWISGGSGPNNFPQYYGLRVLKDGQEIYRNESIATQPNWTLQSFDFSAMEAFHIDAPAVIRIEFLPYCPIGNGAVVSAWDIDEVNIYGGCIVPANGITSVSGRVTTNQGVPVSDAIVNIGKNNFLHPSQETQTDVNGIYHFVSLKKGNAFYLRGQKNDHVLQGVNTLDLIAIQKHLLGLQPFNTLLQWVAADINHDDIVNVMDLLELKKVLLGINTVFPNNTSWRIGNCREITSQFIPDFVETANIPSVVDQQVNFDFLGVKIGDVNEDFKTDIQGEQLSSRNDQQYVIRFDDQNVAEGDKVIVPFKASGDIQLEGIQLMFETGDMELTDIQGGVIPITRECYHVDRQDALRISWSQAESISISADDVLFTLIFSTRSPGQLGDKLHLLHSELQPEIYTNDKTKQIILSTSATSNEIKHQRMSDIVIEPNPFKTSTTIRFQMTESGSVRFVFFNLDGQQLYTVQHDYLQGPQSLELVNGVLPDGETLIYCQMIAVDQVSTQKLVKMR